MVQPHEHGAADALAPIGQDEAHGRAAVGEADILDRRPLEYPSRDEQRAAEDGTGAGHHRRQQRGALQPPLNQRRQDTEPDPYQEVAAQKHGGGNVRILALTAAPVDGGEGEKHTRDRRQHHGHHHHRPHDEQRHQIDQVPRLDTRHRGTEADAHRTAAAHFLHFPG